MRTCVICSEKTVYPMNEVDVGVGVMMTSNELPICERCWNERRPEVDAALDKDLEKDAEFLRMFSSKVP